jgi:hypothetical protein
MTNLPGSKRPWEVDSEPSTDFDDSPHHSPQGESSGVNHDRPVTYGEYLELSKKVDKNHSLLKNIFRFLKKAFPDCSGSPPRDLKLVLIVGVRCRMSFSCFVFGYDRMVWWILLMMVWWV